MTRLPILRAFGTLLLKLCGPATLGPAQYDQPQTCLRDRTRTSPATSRVLPCADTRSVGRSQTSDRDVIEDADRRS